VTPDSGVAPRAVAGSPARTIRIGLTGPIGCGKSTVAGWLRELGAEVIDADVVAREVTGPDSPATAEIGRRFGQDLIGADGVLDRAALGRIVFGDPAALARLEAIVHPAVRTVILARLAEAEKRGAPAVVVEAIKLVEGGLAALCDEVWLVTCDRAQQLERLLDRGADRADAEARIAAQSDIVERVSPTATRIIDTTGSVSDARLRVMAAYRAALGHEAP
jgi:dephospho-CoA kinase